MTRRYKKPQRREHKLLFAGGGGDDGFIFFVPIGVCQGIGFTCDCVLARVVTASCGSGVNVGDEVNVWDLNREHLQLPEELLFTTVGQAHWVKIHESAHDRPVGLTGTCRWAVTRMGCAEEAP